MQIHKAEENYLKALYSLTTTDLPEANTNLIAEHLSTKASSVTDMAKRLADKNLVNYTPYKGLSLSESGRSIALQVIRKHRLWESFLVDTLGFGWDEVHDIAEQLEHIQSEALTDKLDAFLGYPKFDPHGDPIPDKYGNVAKQHSILLANVQLNKLCVIVGVKDSSSTFLKYLEAQGLILGTTLMVIDRFEFDQSLQLEIKHAGKVTISVLVSKNLIVEYL